MSLLGQQQLSQQRAETGGSESTPSCAPKELESGLVAGEVPGQLRVPVRELYSLGHLFLCDCMCMCSLYVHVCVIS